MKKFKRAKNIAKLKGVATLIHDKDFEFIIVAPDHVSLQRACVGKLSLTVKIDTRLFKNIEITDPQ